MANIGNGFPGTDHVIIHTTLGNIKNKYGTLHAAGKQGDIKAARDLINAVAKGEKLSSLKSCGQRVHFMPVLAEEASGRNVIPMVYAQWLAAKCGGVTDASVWQTVRAFHTGSSNVERFIRLPEYAGVVEYGEPYVLVDDHVVMGTTLNSLRSYIEECGGKVVGVTTLSAGYGSNIFNITDSTIDKLKEIDKDGKIEQKLKDEFGYKDGFKSLTNAAGCHILKGDNREAILSYERGIGRTLRLGKENGQDHRGLVEIEAIYAAHRFVDKRIDPGHCVICKTPDGYAAMGDNAKLLDKHCPNALDFYDRDRAWAIVKEDALDSVKDSLDQAGYRFGITAVPNIGKSQICRAIHDVSTFDKRWDATFGRYSRVSLDDGVPVYYDRMACQIKSVAGDIFAVDFGLSPEDNAERYCRQTAKPKQHSSGIKI